MTNKSDFQDRWKDTGFEGLKICNFHSQFFVNYRTNAEIDDWCLDCYEEALRISRISEQNSDK